MSDEEALAALRDSYASCALAPRLQAAGSRLLPGALVSLRLAQGVVATSAVASAQRLYACGGGGGAGARLLGATAVLESDGVALRARSPSGRLEALVREAAERAQTSAAKGAGGGGAPSGGRLLLLQLVDVATARLVCSLVVADAGAAFVGGGCFGASIAWSDDETALAFVVEADTEKARAARRAPLWPRPDVANASAAAAAPEASAAAKPPADSAFEPLSSWGEQMSSLSTGAILHCMLPSRALTLVRPPADLCYGDVVFEPRSATRLVATALLTNAPQRLGLFYCTNRRTRLLCVDVASPLAPVAAPLAGLDEHGLDACARSPLFAPDGRQLLYLAPASTRLHNAGHRVRSLAWPPAAAAPARTLVDVVASPATPGAFPGLYLSRLHAHAWLSPTRLLLTSQRRSRITTYALDVWTGALVDLRTGGGGGGDDDDDDDDDATAATLELIEAQAGQALFLRQTAASLPRAELWSWLDGGDGAVASRARLDVSEPAPPSLAALESRIVRLSENVEVTVVRCAGGGARARTLFVYPHGGPHSAWGNTYVAHVAFLARVCGGVVVLVNFRGSTGFGEDFLNALPGHVGRRDVDDCVTATEWALAQAHFWEASCARPAVVAIGGSHGGFLSAHLSAQRPELFAACVLRNPVTNIASMVGATDIPEWCFAEALGEAWDGRRLEALAADEVARMFACSPAAHVNAVRCPTFVLLGRQDARVPPFQGRDWVAALRRRGVAGVRLLEYPDEPHGIERVDSEADAWLAVATWLVRQGLVDGAAARGV